MDREAWQESQRVRHNLATKHAHTLAVPHIVVLFLRLSTAPFKIHTSLKQTSPTQMPDEFRQVTQKSAGLTWSQHAPATGSNSLSAPADAALEEYGSRCLLLWLFKRNWKSRHFHRTPNVWSKQLIKNFGNIMKAKKKHPWAQGKPLCFERFDLKYFETLLPITPVKFYMVYSKVLIEYFLQVRNKSQTPVLCLL